MRKPANPFNYFINDNDTVEYKFTPGKKPFYVVLKEGSYTPMTVLIWANTPGHVKRILWGLVRFRTECLMKYSSEYEGEITKNLLTQELPKCLQGDYSKYQLTIKEFKPDHAVKVSWASNDTIG